MKLLFDESLSFKLCERLDALFLGPIKYVSRV